jgi:hypothetical protein
MPRQGKAESVRATVTLGITVKEKTTTGGGQPPVLKDSASGVEMRLLYRKQNY